MELLVLSTLKWRMQSITPFSFVHNFLKKITNTDQINSRPSIARVTQLIVGTTKGSFNSGLGTFFAVLLLG